jgi:hypothetical protein
VIQPLQEARLLHWAPPRGDRVAWARVITIIIVRRAWKTVSLGQQSEALPMDASITCWRNLLDSGTGEERSELLRADVACPMEGDMVRGGPMFGSRTARARVQIA